MYGLSGAHRTGKTTLAKAASEQSGVPYVPFETATVFKKLGTSFDEIKTISDRIEIQRAIIAYAHSLYRRQETSFITDRTPIDIAAYLMADAQAHTGTPAEHAAILEMMEDCIDITAQHFSSITTLPPALEYVEAPDKPKPNVAYQWHHHYLCLGIIKDSRLGDLTSYSIRANVTDLQQRANIMLHLMGAAHNQSLFEASVATLH